MQKDNYKTIIFLHRMTGCAKQSHLEAFYKLEARRLAHVSREKGVFLFSKVYSAVIYGVESRSVIVEADVTDGLPQFSIVGYAASEVREATDRVRSALKNSGFPLHTKKITVNLAPADIRKAGTSLDLPIAIAVMAAYGLIPQSQMRDLFLAGELSLNGSIHSTHGILGMVREARRIGCSACILPLENAAEGAMIQDIEVYGAQSLTKVIEHIMGAKKLEKVSINIEEKFRQVSRKGTLDFADIKGQKLVKRAAEIAAAGMHNLLISGPPGSGKTMVAQRIPGILPPISLEESLEISQIHSVAGILPKEGILTSRPFRMPHHTISSVALAGGGTIPRPGEISLAHHGVLYLDELPEFHKDTLEILRQPMEEGEVRISRNSGQFVFPADFMLVASRNPCKCGYYPDRNRCRCSEHEIERYLHRISRPLLDRIDLHVEAQKILYDDLVSEEKPETSAEIRERVLMAQEIQNKRYEGTLFRFNSDLTPSAISEFCPVDESFKKELNHLYDSKEMTARSYHRMIKTARTIADLDGSEQITMKHIGEAIRYRPDARLM